jgi:hypothetical protein
MTMWRRVGGRAISFVVSAAVGFCLVMPAAMFLIAKKQRPPGYPTEALYVLPALLLLVFAALVLPLASWLVLALVGVRPAGFVAFGGWLMSSAAASFVQSNAHGGDVPAWVYAVCAALGYGFTALWARPMRFAAS